MYMLLAFMVQRKLESRSFAIVKRFWILSTNLLALIGDGQSPDQRLLPKANPF